MTFDEAVEEATRQVVVLEKLKKELSGDRWWQAQRAHADAYQLSMERGLPSEAAQTVDRVRIIIHELKARE